MIQPSFSDNYDRLFAGFKDAQAGLEAIIQLNNLKRVASTFGVNSTFLKLINIDEKLPQILNINVSGCESFDPIGDPNSAVSEQVVAGLENVVKNVWNAIVSAIKKVFYFIKDAISNFINRFRSIEKRIGQLKELFKKVPSGAMIDTKAPIKGFPIDGLRSFIVSVVQAMTQIRSLHIDEKFDTESVKNATSDGNTFLGIATPAPIEIQLTNLDYSDIKDYITAIEKMYEFSKELLEIAKKTEGNAQKMLNILLQSGRGEDDEYVKTAKTSLEKNKFCVNLFVKGSKKLEQLIMMGFRVPLTWIRVATRTKSGPQEVKNNNTTKTEESKN